MLAEKEFCNALLASKLSRRLQRCHDGERQNHGAAPRTHTVHMKVEPLGEPNDFRWNGRHGVPTNLSERRKIEVTEAVALLCSTHGTNHRTRAAHVRRIRRVAIQLQTEIGLHCCAQVNGASWILTPTTIDALLRTQVANNFLQRVDAIAPVRHCGALLPQDPLHQQVFALQNRVALQFRAPVTIDALQALQRNQRIAGSASEHLKGLAIGSGGGQHEWEIINSHGVMRHSPCSTTIPGRTRVSIPACMPSLCLDFQFGR